MAGGTNPSLGVRAIRFARRRPDIFRTQLRAFYRAAAVGPLRIMFPLESGISELDDARSTCAGIVQELEREGVAFARDVPIGVMIETPSAALTTDHLAGNSSFFSIGTNDLIQLRTFRGGQEGRRRRISLPPVHPAFLRLLKSAIPMPARVAGDAIAVCGDMAGEPAFTWILVALGVRSLDVASLPSPR
jgi:phosphotransferase system enzyme I (PtsI)